ncbi:MAG TPA: glycosyltransferase [Bacteroidetes bacterium]|nr:glycosyltransferase [Bacteroidota bacterium]
MTNNNAIIIFIKNIVPGKVKTRLAATVGNEQAVKIYEALLERTRQEALKVAVSRYVFYSTFIEKNDEWKDAHFTKKTQRGANIGERMSNSFIDIMPPVKSAVLVGGDIAGLTAEILQQALQKLKDHDFVLGPAFDGGYYLIGMNKPEPSIFENIEWSHPDVTKTTLQNIERLNKTCHILPTLSDIDYEEDWVKYGWDV